MNRRKFIKVATSAVVGIAVAPKAKAYQSSSTAKSSSSSQTDRLCRERRPGCNCQGFSSCYHSSSSSQSGPSISMDREACGYKTDEIWKAMRTKNMYPVWTSGYRGPCGLDPYNCPFPNKKCSSSTRSSSSSSYQGSTSCASVSDYHITPVQED